MPPMRASWAFDCSKPSGRALTCYFKLERRAAGSFPHLVSTSTAVPRLQYWGTRGGAQSCHALHVGRPFAAATPLPRHRIIPLLKFKVTGTPAQSAREIDCSLLIRRSKVATV
ncbi:hypothetical protein VFPFJ_10408 [Purpureocillium lilacinum]|uniref:Uncharacterized protein n=1 Tax=Purpureocillium lilacinum TaxID=33203 RepID=A0A179GHN1_PURLI|nr:hypothetical protein VFPFJ_10408 [Purpureocillium lilacinum]OAQ76871.1 hypothetical protein VFPFJ_10408 [Purpureocillium lilacinum]OAQ78279.1 hypothetical protein VFPBJ_06398 [Purpureocillium lilacinum]